MSKFKVKKNELQKARDKLERVSKRQKQIQFNFVRHKTKGGRFKTTIFVERGIKEQHSGRGLLHRAYNARLDRELRLPLPSAEACRQDQKKVHHFLPE